MISIFAAIGFILSVVTFIGGFRMVRRTDQPAEIMMHRINGYITIAVYIITASLAIQSAFAVSSIVFWLIGLSAHLFKILLARKGLAVRYGGYMGAMLLITWLVVIFTHLPS